MTGSDRLDPLDRQLAPLLASGEASGPPTPECLDDEVISALAEGTIEPGQRIPALVHVASCTRCRAAVASVALTLADANVRQAIRGSEDRGARRFGRLAVPLTAAAVLLLLFSLPRRGVDDSGPHRGTPTPGGPVAVSPHGVVAEARVLRWADVLGADRYRITVFDHESKIVFAAEVDDTLLLLPESSVLKPGQPYVWIVEARTGWGRWSASAPVAFTIAPGGVP